MGNAFADSSQQQYDLGGGNYGGIDPTPAGWQLPVGHYEDTYTAAEVIFPRPDTETPVWAKHRRHYPGIKYEIPIGVSFGSWPFYFELITAPAGMVIGQFLTVSGDKLITPDDYGVVSWDNPTVGNHSIDVRVSFQDGTTPINIQWNLEVTTTGTIFVDATRPDDTGDGLTPATAFKTLEGWVKADTADRTFTQYQVCYRAGTYDVVTTDPATSGNIQLNWFNKPLVHYAYNDEAAVWDFDLGNFTVAQSPPANPGSEVHFSDWYIGGVSCIGGASASDNVRRWNLNEGASGPYPYDGTGGGNRCTWYKSPQSSWQADGDTTDNSAIVFGSNPFDVAKARNYWLVSNCDITNITTTTSVTNFGGWYIGNFRYLLAQNLSTSGNNFGRGAFYGKSSQSFACIRNIDASQDHTAPLEYYNAGSYAPLIGGGSELSYCKVNYQASGANFTAVSSGSAGYPYGESDPLSSPDNHFRNNVSKAPATLGECFRALDDWPVAVHRDIWCSQGDGIYLNPPSNTQGEGEWELYAVAANPFDANMELTGASRVSFLGTKGAEVAA